MRHYTNHEPHPSQKAPGVEGEHQRRYGHHDWISQTANDELSAMTLLPQLSPVADEEPRTSADDETADE